MYNPNNRPYTLYRAKTRNNQWVYSNDGVCRTSDKTFLPHVYECTDENGRTFFSFSYTEVQPDTVCRSTGVSGEKLDSMDEYQSTEIYEGDIVTISYDGEILNEGLVEYKYGAFLINCNDDMTHLLYETIHPLGTSLPSLSPARFELTIQGNRFDNPHLMKEIFDD